MQAHTPATLGLDANRLDRVDQFLEEAVQTGKLPGAAILIARHGKPLPEANPNGSVNDIAGIVNDRGNVLGLMPHPEDAVDPLLGSTDGLGLFESILARVAV